MSPGSKSAGPSPAAEATASKPASAEEALGLGAESGAGDGDAGADAGGSVDGEVAAASAAEALLPGRAGPLDGGAKGDAVDEAVPALTKEEMIEEALNCPCIAGMKEGPCGAVFLEAYKCFLRSETSPQGMECMDHFVAMHGCMAEHPEEYDLDSDDDHFAPKPDGEGHTPNDHPARPTPATDAPIGVAASIDTTSPHAASKRDAQEKPKPPDTPAVEVPPQTPIAAASPLERPVPAVLVYARSLYRRFFEISS